MSHHSEDAPWRAHEDALEELIPEAEISWVLPSRFRGPPVVEVHAILRDASKSCSVWTELTTRDEPTIGQLVEIAAALREKLGLPMV